MIQNRFLQKPELLHSLSQFEQQGLLWKQLPKSQFQRIWGIVIELNLDGLKP